MADIRRATPEDWAAVRDVRLRALADSPAAFASTLEREVALDEGAWRRRISDGPWWLAEEAGHPVGLVAAYPPHGDERYLVAMWMEPAHRGTGTAGRLVETVCAWAGEDGASAVALLVVDGNDRARRFYERLGFAPTGMRQPLPSNPAVGEEQMRRMLRG